MRTFRSKYWVDCGDRCPSRLAGVDGLAEDRIDGLAEGGALAVPENVRSAVICPALVAASSEAGVHEAAGFASKPELVIAMRDNVRSADG